MLLRLDYNANVIRGWPNEGALDRDERITNAVSLSNGDWVTKASDNTVGLVGATKTANAGLVIRGNADSGSGAYTGKATVLWGNFIAQIKNLPAAVTFLPGSSLTIQNGRVQLAVGTDPVIGHVLDVIAASSVADAHIVAVIH
jgi:hypothetical protein